MKIGHGKGAFLDMVEYLVHERPKAVEQGKTHYDDEITVSSGFDFRKELTDLQRNRAKHGKRAGKMSQADTMRMHVVRDGWTMRMCREDDPLTYAKIRSTLPPLRLDYLFDSEPCPFRMNIYVDGPAGIGKSSMCRYIAESMFGAYDNPYFSIGNDERVSFDGYDGEPAIIWNDFRVTDFIQQFKPQGTYRLLDTHPGKEAQQAKHSRVILTNALNIINGVQPYEEFIAGLAGTYTDKHVIHHHAEDENQVWRRFPMILRIRENDFDVLINEGFVNNDLSSIKTMTMYANVRGFMKAIMEKLEGKAKEKVLVDFGKPVMDAVHMIETSHADKITNPDELPSEFLEYGKVKNAADLQREKQEEVEAKFQEELEEYEMLRFDSLA